MPRPIVLQINKGALRRNLARMREAARGRFLWAVVKADAYGHGLLNALDAFAEADGLCTIEVRDAVLFRENGWRKPVLMLEGFFDASDVRGLEAYGIETNVHSLWQVEMLEAMAPFKRLQVRVKVNSGMNRLGFPPAEAPAVKRRLEAVAGVEVLGYVTHFANAEPTAPADGPMPASRQIARLGALAAEPGGCFANSAAAIFQAADLGGAVRAGITLYGASPDGNVSAAELGIEPAMTLKARIIAVQELAPGEPVGYGSRWTASRPSRVAVVACGYADGYPRRTPDGAPVWVEGRRAVIAGSPSMDMLGIDVTDVPGAEVGSWVELWGPHVTVDELAAHVGTIGYELLCSVMERVPVQAFEEPAEAG
ncbi:MAG: alanine racemase [Duodenibacillus sp.]|nr:alanine racemase [Duodenibacillus sp.]